MSTGPTPAVRARILERDQHACALSWLGPCHWRLSLQHRVARQMGGSGNTPWINWPQNLVTICGDGTVGHHHWVEDHPALAEALGYSVRRGRNAEHTLLRLTAQPVLLADGFQLPTDEYQWVPV